MTKTYGNSCETVYSGPCSIVIFGASGDLTKRKLIPALFDLYITNRVPTNFYILGFARSNIDENVYREIIIKSLEKIESSFEKKEKFASRCYYFQGKYNKDDSYLALKSRVDDLNKQYKTEDNIIYNLSVPPTLYTKIVTRLGRNRLIKKGQNSKPFQRVVIEKPFGTNLISSTKLNSILNKYLFRKQIYRIDHYLGKDAVQNIFVFRFANSIFEPIWNRDAIDHVQITVSESLGIGNRAGYFETTGLIRDMFQNHMLQLLAFVAMEPPASFEEESVRDEKVKVFKSIMAYDLKKLSENLVLGQYENGIIDGKTVNAYHEEKEVKSDSLTETYFATKIFIENWRWQGVPFYLRCGKRLNSKESKISMVFKKTPKSLFKSFGIKDNFQNVLTFNIHPEQGVTLSVQEKMPNSKMCIETFDMNFNYKQTFGQNSRADYDSLLLDCMLGDQTLFWRGDSVCYSWKLLTPVLNHLENRKNCELLLYKYKSGTSGPKEADQLIENDGKKWL